MTPIRPLLASIATRLLEKRLSHLKKVARERKKTAFKNIIEKTGCKNTAGLVVYALKNEQADLTS